MPGSEDPGQSCARGERAFQFTERRDDASTIRSVIEIARAAGSTEGVELAESLLPICSERLPVA